MYIYNTIQKSDKTLDPTIFYSYDITSPHKKCIPLPYKNTKSEMVEFKIFHLLLY